MINKLGHWIAYHPKTVLIVCLLMLVPSVFGYLGTFVNYDLLTYLPKELDSVEGERILDETFHNAASSVLVVKDTPAKDIVALKEKIRVVDGVSNVIWVDDIVDITIPAEILPDILTSLFYSEDGSSTLLMIQYSDGGASDRTQNAIKEIRKLMDSNDLLSGLSAITADTKALTDSQAPMYIAIAIALALVALSLTMTSWVLPFILLAALGAAVLYNMGSNIFFGQISYITQSIAAILQLGVTMDYSVFLIDRFEEEKHHYESKSEAMAHAVSSSFVSLSGSSLTTVFGFLALCFMTFTLGLDIGLVMAKGVVLGVLTVMTLLPALVLMFDGVISKTAHRSLVPHFGRLNTFLLKHKKIIAVIFLVLFIPAYLGRSSVDVYYNMADALPQDLPSIAALNKLKDDFKMATTHFVIVDSELSGGDAAAMTHEMEQVDGITEVLSLSSIVGASIPSDILPEDIIQICAKDGKQLMMLSTGYVAATDEANAQIDSLIEIIHKYDPQGLITGEGAMTNDLVDVTKNDFKITSVISIAAIFVLIAICFKSLSLPVVLVASIELAIMLNLACSFIFGEEIPFIGPTIIGCVQLGATVDYAILLTTRFREELHKGTDRLAAIKKAADESDRSVFQSALVFFCATLGVYLICDIAITKIICLLLARGALISALVIIFMLTPVLLLSEGVVNKTSLGWRKPKNKSRSEQQ